MRGAAPLPSSRWLPIRATSFARASDPPPFQQGQLDGLCGLYAIVNALALLFSRCAPLTYGDCYQLFQLGLETIAPPGELAATVAEGVDLRLWRRTATLLAQHAAREQGYDLRVTRPFRGLLPVRPAGFHRTLRTALDRDGVVLAMLCGALHHFTVIGGHDATRYRLFDSSGLHWLAKSACGLPDSSARHRFSTSTLLVLELAS